ncbi:hypothetical protein HZH66_013438 [Vespula vulgaris]|uniref:Uncharacterized protein n=1 Tax=Vespula vulgaris TaxID=7454 RepID=A0A834JAE9_VESVU|nr:hypothetical protein HZH66_013438 [Vespula vulgaris]
MAEGDRQSFDDDDDEEDDALPSPGRYRPTRSLAEFVLRRTIEFLAPLSSPIPYRFQGARGGAESRRKRNEWRPDGKEKTSRNGENVAGKKRKGWYKSTRPSSLLLSETGSSIDSPEVTAIEDFSIVASHEYSDKRNRSKVGYPSNAKSKPQSDFDEIWKATRDGRDRLLSTFFPIDTWTSTSLGIRASKKRFWGKFGDVAWSPSENLSYVCVNARYNVVTTNTATWYLYRVPQKSSSSAINRTRNPPP